jgi:hypothetical protein
MKKKSPSPFIQLNAEDAKAIYEHCPSEENLQQYVVALEAEARELRYLQEMAVNTVQRMERAVAALSEAVAVQAVELVLLRADA